MTDKKTYERIEDTGSTLPRIDVENVLRALGAVDVSSKCDSRTNRFSIHAVRKRLLEEIVSTGGRPARRDVSTRRKIPLTDTEWNALQNVATLLATDGIRTTAGQVAGVLVRQSIVQLFSSMTSESELVKEGDAIYASDESQVENILAAAASAGEHIERLRPVALELLRRMRQGRGVESDDQELNPS